PANRSRQAKLIERGGIVIVHPRRQDVLFPSVRRNFETLQLTHGLQQSAFAAQLRLRRNVLPAQQPAHILRRGDWLDLLAQGGDREVVNARQQSPVAPLGGGWLVAFCPSSEVSAQHRTRRLHAEKRLFDLGCRQA